MKRFALIGVLAVLLLCSACGKQAEQGELSRVVFARGHGSTWGNQFRMEVCPTEVSYTHFFEKTEQGREFRELFAVPIEEAQWKQIETATRKLFPRLQEQKPPGLIKRLAQALGPKEVDGGAWWSLTLTWMIDDKPQEVQYLWPSCEEADALAQLLEELAQDLDQ